MSAGNAPDVTSPASRTAPAAASAYGRHLVRVRVPSRQANPHWWIEPHTSRKLAYPSPRRRNTVTPTLITVTATAMLAGTARPQRRCAENITGVSAISTR